MHNSSPGYLSGLRIRIRKWIDAALNGTHDHYFSCLPVKKGRLSTWLLKLFFSGIKDNPDQLAVIDSIPEDAAIVYLNKFKSKTNMRFGIYVRYCG